MGLSGSGILLFVCGGVQPVRNTGILLRAPLLWRESVESSELTLDVRLRVCRRDVIDVC